MRKFEVYKHPVLGLEIVKQGFSWPAFFFPFIWMLFKMMWRRAAVWFVVAFTLSIVHDFTEGSESLIGKLVFVLAVLSDLALWLAPAVAGNRWRAEDLSTLGYRHVVTLEAKSAAEALAQIQAEQSAAGDARNARA